MSEYWSNWHATRRINRRRLLAAGAAATGVGMIAACGSSSNNKSTAANSSTTSNAAKSTGAAATPAVGAATAASKAPTGTITVMQGVDANTLDPDFTNATPEGNILRQMLEYMLYFNPKTFQPEPFLIEMPKALDTTTWELKLRVTNAKFHDGTPVDANAIKFSLDRVAPPDGKWGGKPIVPSFARLVNYASAEVIDPLTVHVHTKAPAAVLPTLLSYGVPVLPPSVYMDQSAANLQRVAAKAVGSGPFKFVEWVKDDHVAMTVNTNYWGKMPAFAKAVWKPVSESSTRLLAVERGDADIVVNVPPDQVDQVTKAGAQVSQVQGGRIIYVGMRCDHTPFNDKRVRQAVNHAMNFDAINKALLNGNGMRAASLMNPPHVPPNAKPITYDPAMAKQLLAAAGLPNGFTTNMDFPQGRYIKDSEMAQAIIQDLAKVGIKANPLPQEWSVYAGDKLAKQNPDDMFFLGLGSPFTGQEEANYLSRKFSLQETHWSNDQYESLLSQLVRTLDPTKRQDLMNQLNTIAFDECPWLFIYHQVDYYGYSKRLNWQARPDEGIYAFEATYKA